MDSIRMESICIYFTQVYYQINSYLGIPMNSLSQRL